ncbi:MAG TPA: ABC transporter ATP-binding protein [Kofleriaceae bacterium]|nr:ABC transporter ATP-binding protein [Kofleriaceae bacterium]
MTAVVAVEQLTKRFGARAVVDGVSFGVAKGGVLALLGPSGSGKSTTLRLIAGLDHVDGGRVLLDGEPVSTPAALVPPEQRRVGFVFQSVALFPHLTALDNVAFGARDRARAGELLALVGLEPRAAARVHTLSGGEQQRVALARALAIEPRVVLLDEPFANLDAALRRHLRDEIAHTLRARETTAILVTHDASEAFAVADHVAVMSDGKLLQHGTPEDVYARPASLEVASRTGELVRLAGRLTARGTVETCLGELALARPAAHGGEVIAIARPEQVVVDPAGIPARVRRRVFEGASTSLALELDGQPLALRVAGALAASPGDDVPIAIRAPVLVFPR